MILYFLDVSGIVLGLLIKRVTPKRHWVDLFI